jgi:hypothetical protein
VSWANAGREVSPQFATTARTALNPRTREGWAKKLTDECVAYASRIPVVTRFGGSLVAPNPPGRIAKLIRRAATVDAIACAYIMLYTRRWWRRAHLPGNSAWAKSSSPHILISAVVVDDLRELAGDKR